MAAPLLWGHAYPIRFCAQPVAGSPAAAQTAPAAPAPAEDLVKVALDTSAGRIVLALDRGHAPVTTKNFLRYVDAGRFNGESFYRAMKFGERGGLVQAGITSDARKLYPAIEHEPVSKTGIKHVGGHRIDGGLLAGNRQGRLLHHGQRQPVVRRSFAAFGHVVEGMDVVKTILASPTSATKGEGVMKGQMLDPVVKITKASRVP